LQERCGYWDRDGDSEAEAGRQRQMESL
jgi:hypothetical protein